MGKEIKIKNSVIFLLTIFAAAAVGYLLIKILGADIISMAPKEKNPTLNYILESGISGITRILIVIMYFSIGSFFVVNVVSFAWSNILREFVGKFYDLFEQKLMNLDKNFSSLADNVNCFIRSHRNPSSLNDCSRTEEIDFLITSACRELYGRHIVNDSSFYQYVKNTLIDSFCREPHPSNVNKKIDVQIDKDNPDYIMWHEITNYKVHHVMRDQNQTICKYDIRYRTTSFAPGKTDKEWVDNLSLTIRVNGRTEVTQGTEPTFEKDTGKEGFFCWKKGDWIEIVFRKTIDLDKEWTDIFYEEKSINSIKDKTYTLFTNKPNCNYSLEFTLPNNFEFLSDPFVSTKIIYSGLPDFAQAKLPKKTTVEHRPANHMLIDIKEWVMPGIIVNLSWVEKEN